jgi:hypothetical protein
MRLISSAAAVLLLVLLPATPRAVNAVVEMRVTPRLAIAPADVFVSVTIDRDVDNRQMEIIVESLTYLRASTIDLEGQDAPRVNTLRFRQLPAGRYEVRVRLLDGNGHERGWERRFLSLT